MKFFCKISVVLFLAVLLGTPVEIKSELTENAIDFGLTWRF